MVRRPYCCSCLATSTAWRISLTPPSTAEMARNRASKPSAMRLASVVLPTPGGPQKIMESGRPESKADRRGLPGPSKCAWPTTSSTVRGRKRSTSDARRRGWPAPLNRSALSCMGSLHLHPVHVVGNVKTKGVGIQVRIGLQVGQANPGGLTEGVVQDDLAWHGLIKANVHMGKAGVCRQGFGSQPLQALCVGPLGQVKRIGQVIGTKQDGRGRRPYRFVNITFNDLGQIGVVLPQLPAIRENKLLVRLGGFPAKLAGPLKSEYAVLSLPGFLPGIIFLSLLKTAAGRLNRFNKLFKLING